MSANASIKERVAELQGVTADVIADACDLARRHAREVIQTLVGVMQDERAPAAARVTAAQAILDRGYGKAPQPIEANVNLLDSMSYEDKQVLLAVLDALASERPEDETPPTRH